MADDLDDGVIEVQVIPQDDNWGETNTITETATSVCTDLEDVDMGLFDDDDVEHRNFSCLNFKQTLSIIFSIGLGIFAILSPIAFLVMPNLISNWKTDSCAMTCGGMYISIGVKELVLLVGIWALYFRPTKAFMPRIDVFKVGMLSIGYLVVTLFWLFYVIQIFGKKSSDLSGIVSFAIYFIDSMLFLHYLALLLMWIRHQENIYNVSVIRNVDGSRKHYMIGQCSIQKAAVNVLEKYYIDFNEYNPYLPRPTSRSKINKFSNIKFYDLDNKMDMGNGKNFSQQASKAVIAAAALGRRKEGRNDRFYEELEIDRRVRKRKARLVAAAEEAFGHIARLNAFDTSKKANGSMNPDEAAQAIFPTLARPLQKYLRTTRQQLHYPLESIMKHLAHCIMFDMSARAFLERYTCDQPCVGYVSSSQSQDWTLISDFAATKQLSDGMIFQLQQNDISLVVVVSRTPIFKISEHAYDIDTNRFILRLSSETSV
uniref:Vang-like protein 1 n=1 Tax=Hydra vulgaris TaxID=6087 RepID=T2M8K0_HYDVU|nr:vang-like protein 2-B isoform X1 [Hydra vulgaris]